jgi:hypothetical protein
MQIDIVKIILSPGTFCAMALLLPLSACGGDNEMGSSSTVKPQTNALVTNYDSHQDGTSPTDLAGASGPSGSPATKVPNLVRGVVATALGTDQTSGHALVTFQTSSGVARNLIADVSTLPAGWSLEAGGVCSEVTTKSDCTLRLIYVPNEMSGNNLFYLSFIYENNLGLPKKDAIIVYF